MEYFPCVKHWPHMSSPSHQPHSYYLVWATIICHPDPCSGLLTGPSTSSPAFHRLFSTQWPEELLKPKSDEMTSLCEILQRVSVSLGLKTQILMMPWGSLDPTPEPVLPHLPLSSPLLTALLDSGFLSIRQHTRHITASGPLHLPLFSHYTLLQITHTAHLLHVVLWFRIKMIIYVCVCLHI